MTAGLYKNQCKKKTTPLMLLKYQLQYPTLLKNLLELYLLLCHFLHQFSMHFQVK